MTRSYLIIIILALFIVIAAGFQVLNKSGKNQEPQTSTLSQSVASVLNLETQTNDEGSVAITVAPRISAGAKNLEFEITLDTHSVELNEDLTKTAILVADTKTYYPIAWDGDAAGGHHRKGVLRFTSISPQPKEIALKILQVGGIEERIFSWQIQ